MKNLKEVDWGKAPEGATHYCMHPASTYRWLKDSPLSYYDEELDKWVKYISDFGAPHISDSVEKPNETWDGVGLPPVGTICMLNEGRDMNAYYAHHAGKKLKIVAHTTSSKGDILAVYMVIGEDEFHGLTNNHNFKPIKTPEQIAAEERIEKIDEMIKVVKEFDTYSEVCEALYDAGYRKQGA